MEEEKKLSKTQALTLRDRPIEEQERITKLFFDNINLANKFAQKYYKTGYWEYDDTIQIARMALWKACLIWDESKYKLSTLATNIMINDFINYDMKQKRQPNILFSMDEYCVTEDLTLGDVIEDTSLDVHREVEEIDTLKEFNQSVIELLDTIAEEQKVSPGIVKLLYLTNIENNQYNSNEDFKIKNLKGMRLDQKSAVIKLIKERIKELIQERNTEND